MSAPGGFPPGPTVGSRGADFAPEPLRVARLELRDFRNVSAITIEPSARFNVISGDNGQGKTSLLEAIYAVATSRSFRTERYRELRRDGSELTRVEADVWEGTRRRSQRLVLSAQGRSVLLNGDRPRRLADYATRTPVVVFHPGDLSLTMGAAAARRDLLDRVALFADPAVSDDRRRYRESLRQRQKALELRGTRAPELSAYEQLAAHHGARLTRARAEATRQLGVVAVPGFRELVANDRLSFEIGYRPAGDVDEARFVEQLAERREADRRRHLATFGPHRDELSLCIDGRPARKHASQGQHRILSLTLKLAELSAIRQARGAHPILLLDDVSSELDPTRTFAVYAFLQQSPGQVFVTTTRPELFETPGARTDDRRDYRLIGGALDPSAERAGGT